MRIKFLTAVALTLAVFAASVSLAEAGQHHQGGGGSGSVGHAVPRGGGGGGGYPGGGHPGYPGGGYGHYHYPYYGYYGYYGYPYGYYPYGWGWSIGIGFGYGYPYGYAGYGYPYGYYGYPGYAPNYGGVKIAGAPGDASVFVDGYYVGVADDFDGTFQQINLEAGPHHIEVTKEGAPPAAVDVNIRPGQTVTFRTN